MNIKTPKEIKQNLPSRVEILAQLKTYVKGHIEITESVNSYHIYINNTDYCCKTFYSFMISKEELHYETLYSIINKILNNYKSWISEKYFY